MKITVFGAGYVGLVTGVCLAELGNDVLCVDVDQAKLALLNQGKSPIFEPGLSELMQRNVEAKRLLFSDDMQRAVTHGEYLFIAVGTPAAADGSADLQYVLKVAETIGHYLDHEALVIDKSTVPVGTADRVRDCVQRHLKKDVGFSVVSNPEFLKQGAAVHDFMEADRIIIGVDDERALKKMRQLYAPISNMGQNIIAMDVRSAELTKYAANAFLATKISYMNELSRLSEVVGADIEKVRIGMGSDPRIGRHFLKPGCGYGGSCFPKDVSALAYAGKEHGCDMSLLRAVDAVNQRQKKMLFEKILGYFKGELEGRVIALWGLAFKPNTDDLREASSLVLMESLWAAGASIQAYDPVAMPNTRRIYGDRSGLTLCDSPKEALEEADVLAIVTEWDVFCNPNFSHIKQTLRYPVIFDGRNLYDPAEMAQLGLEYYSVGRGKKD